MRTFLNVANRWSLSLADRIALLQCNGQEFEKWSSIARSAGLLVLETPVLMRISAILGVFAELKQLFASLDHERDWLTRANMAAPFNGRAPLELLRGSLEEQIAVRRYSERIGRIALPPNKADSDSTRYRIVWKDARPQIRAVCFDGFGTLVDIADKRRPFRALLGDNPTPDAVHRILTTPTSLRDLARHLAIDLNEKELTQLEADLDAECGSTHLRAGVEVAWETLHRLGLKVAVCSNLAMPYRDALVGCLPRAPNVLVLSFEVGLMKPQAEIYRLVCSQLGLEPDQVVFVGDSLEADVHGPQAAGLFALHIDAFEAGLAKKDSSGVPGAIAELFKRAGALHQLGLEYPPYSPDQALDVALGAVNASTSMGCERDHLLRVLRAPAEVVLGDDPALKLLLSTFFDEAIEPLLMRIAEGTEITWADLSQAAQAALQPGHPKRAWIVGRATKSADTPP